jgi:hypothetical protein
VPEAPPFELPPWDFEPPVASPASPASPAAPSSRREEKLFSFGPPQLAATATDSESKYPWERNECHPFYRAMFPRG